MGLEKKEKMEEKMDSIKEVQVKLFKCKQVGFIVFLDISFFLDISCVGSYLFVGMNES